MSEIEEYERLCKGHCLKDMTIYIYIYIFNMNAVSNCCVGLLIEKVKNVAIVHLKISFL